MAEGQTARTAFDLGTEAAPAPEISRVTARDWTPAELAAMDPGARNGAAMAGRDAVVDVVTGAITAAETAGQAAIVGIDRGAQALAGDMAGAAHALNPVTEVARALDLAIPDQFADRHAEAL